MGSFEKDSILLSIPDCGSVRVQSWQWSACRQQKHCRCIYWYEINQIISEYKALLLNYWNFRLLPFCWSPTVDIFYFINNVCYLSKLLFVYLADAVEFGSGKYYALCGLGGLISCGLTHTMIVPLDLVKCRIQTNPAKYKSVFGGFRV